MVVSKQFKYRQVNLTVMALLPLWLAGCAMPVVTPANDMQRLAPQVWSTYAQSLDLVERVQKSSPQVESALATLRQARASIESANAGLWPSASVGANAQRTRAMGVTENTYKANLSGSWDINLHGLWKR